MALCWFTSQLELLFINQLKIKGVFIMSYLMTKETFKAIVKGSDVKTAAKYAVMCNVPLNVCLSWVK